MFGGWVFFSSLKLKKGGDIMFFTYLAGLIAVSKGSVDGYTIYIHNFKNPDKLLIKFFLIE